MAYRKVDEASLTEVADAIRAKGGTTDQMEFPGGFVSAVQAIETGGGDDGFVARTATSYTNALATSVGAYFAYKYAALTSIDLPSATSIGDYAFSECSNLALISLSNDLTTIGNYAFYKCTSLALTSLPDGVTSIGDYAFYNCGNITLTSLPNYLTSIGSDSFNSCGKIALTSLPAGIKSIGSDAFRNCGGLTSITFEGTPAGAISSTAFSSCTNLTTINVPWAEGAVKNAPWGATKATINYNYTGE